MDSSVLEDIKKMLGIQREYTAFDTDIIININMAIGILNQIGIGVDGFYLTGYEQTWDDLLGETHCGFQIVKDYVYLRVRLVFDPPASGVVLESYQAMCTDLECRLKFFAETEEKSEELINVGGQP